MLVAKLKKEIEGEVKADLMSRQIYSVDASIFEITPHAIVLPKTKQDVLTTLAMAAEYGIPIIPRGGGTGQTGGCLGEGIIVDTSKYLTKITALDKEYAVCEPGVVQDTLNQQAASLGMRLGADTATGNRATIGGMTANNSAGIHSLRYGAMVDNVLEVEMALSDGSLVTLGERLDPRLEPIAHTYGEEIAAHFPKLQRRSSGLTLDPLHKVAIGSEGILGLFTSITVKLSPLLRETSLVVLPFGTLEEALSTVPEILTHHPSALEVIDHHVMAMGRLSPALRGRLEWLEGSPGALLIVEFEGKAPLGTPLPEKEHENVWALRKAGVGLLLSRRSYSRAIAFIEDCSVPPENLSGFVAELKDLIGEDVGVHGHAGAGCLHVRPYVNLHTIESIFPLMQKMTTLVKRHGGVLSGEHGDGLLRAWLNPHLFGEKLMAAFQAIKTAFDPQGIMNPGKILPGIDPKQNVRPVPKEPLKTFQHFEGGIELAADLCNGNGQCRKSEGLMCPSFQVTQDERLTTRARAQVLRSLVTGKVPLSELKGEGLHDVLDLCLECKGCKTECPSQIDMAKMKSEILYQRGQYSLRDRLFAHFPKWAPRLGWLPVPKKLLGIAQERELPKPAKVRFSKWWAKRAPVKNGKQVVLFLDTYTEFFSPEIGKAAVEVLERFGYAVIVPPWQCCGRPLLSKGMLPEAFAGARRLLKGLEPYLDLPIIGLEPSCLLTLSDDYGHLHSHTLELFDAFILPFLEPPKERVLVHAHCHQKALAPVALPGFEEIPSGCCGMAGSFGYESEHYALSMAIGRDRLFPAIEKAPKAPIIASGFSCRAQIAHGTGRHALHLAQYLKTL